MLRQRIVFHGWVQGVGFRYWAKHAADRYGATGWVRNNPDNTVTMEIQGTKE
jgi:acylphosphatase